MTKQYTELIQSARAMMNREFDDERCDYFIISQIARLIQVVANAIENDKYSSLIQNRDFMIQLEQFSSFTDLNIPQYFIDLFDL